MEWFDWKNYSFYIERSFQNREPKEVKITQEKTNLLRIWDDIFNIFISELSSDESSESNLVDVLNCRGCMKNSVDKVGIPCPMPFQALTFLDI